MRVVAAVLAVGLLVAFGAAQPKRAVAVAPFWDLSADGASVDAERLNMELLNLLDRTGRFQVVPPDRVAQAMRSRRYWPSDLFHPARAREVREAVGADWLVVGRWTHLDTLAHGDSDLPRPPLASGAVAVLELWVWEPGRNQPRYEATFDSFWPGAGGTLALRLAAEAVLRKAAAALAGL